jgi:hypothetical protein
MSAVSPLQLCLDDAVPDTNELWKNARRHSRNVPRANDTSMCRESAAYFATVRNGAVWLPSRCHHGCMLHKKSKKDPDNAIRASVRKESRSISNHRCNG